MVAVPHFYNEPNVTIGTTEVQCHISLVTLIPQTKKVDVETYCNRGGQATVVERWSGILRVRMSYGSDSSWAFFSTIDPTVEQDVVIYPADPGTGGATAANPSATFDAFISPIAFIPDHAPGESATFDIEFEVIGEPTFDSTP